MATIINVNITSGSMSEAQVNSPHRGCINESNSSSVQPVNDRVSGRLSFDKALVGHNKGQVAGRLLNSAFVVQVEAYFDHLPQEDVLSIRYETFTE